MNIWLTSDHHFGHANILTFKDDQGLLIRPGFKDVQEMDELMVERWNECVKPGDRVYHLGDVAMNVRTLDAVLPRLNGSKRLILGNHDVDVLLLRKYFKKVSLWRVFKDEGFVCTHIPLMPGQFRQRTVLNVHGHIHQNLMDQPTWFNVCVEHHQYRPVHMDVVLDLVKELRRAGIFPLGYDRDAPETFNGEKI